MSAAGIAACGAVLFFLALTLVYQCDRFGSRISQYDLLHILPRWTFFAPNPAMRDCHIVCRDRLVNGSLSPWTPVRFSPGRTAMDVIWHPGKRPRKVLSDAAQSLKRMRRRSASGLQYSLPYILILRRCVAQYPPSGEALARPFALVETSGRDDRRLWITFTSEFHPF
jgi:hypothetical protein